jgi:tRNA-modifying protein YgfZ
MVPMTRFVARQWLNWLASRARIVTISPMTRNVKDFIVHAAPLTVRALISIRGADAGKLLQGQLSNDVTGLAVGEQQCTSLSNPKGRLLAVGFLARSEPEHFLFDVPAAIADSVVKRLRLFILRSDVQINRLESWRAAAVLDHPSDSSANTVSDLPDGGFIATRPGTPRRRIIWRPRAPDAADEVNADVNWQIADIRAGVVNLCPDTQDRHIAQHAGVERLGGLNFSKGCYTGQEIIARLHYLGKSKRHLAYGQSRHLPDAGDHLINTADQSACGEVASVVHDGNHAHWLAVVQGQSLTAAHVALASGDAVETFAYFENDPPHPAD